MEANELRIGNYVYYNKTHKDICRVSQIRKEILFSKEELIGLNYRIDVFYESKDIEPIPLTEEWLLKFGFEYNNYPDSLTLNVLSFGRLNAYSISKDLTIELSTQSGYMFGTTKIKNVHELQNLYFALTKIELTIKI